MAEHARLSEERLKLIRRFMGEPADEGAEQSDPPVPVQPLDSGPASARTRPSLPARARVSRARRSTPSHGASVGRARVRSERKLIKGIGPLLRHRFTLRWPIAAIIMGVIVGVLIARVA
jgi:hypothetical protein